MMIRATIKLVPFLNNALNYKKNASQNFKINHIFLTNTFKIVEYMFLVNTSQNYRYIYTFLTNTSLNCNQYVSSEILSKLYKICF